MSSKKDENKDIIEDRTDDEDEPEWYDEPEDDEDESEWYDKPEDLEDPAATEEPAAEIKQALEEKPAVESVEKPAAESAQKPSSESVEKPAAESAEEPAAESGEKPAAESAEDSGKPKKPASVLRFLGNLGDPADHPGPQRFVTYLLLPLVIVYYEILARLVTRTALFPSLLFPIMFAAALGFILSAVLSLLGPKLRWVLTNILIAAIAFYYGLEVVLRNTYQTYMNLSTIFSELGNVTGNYGGDVANAIKGAIPVIILYYIPFILRLVLRKTYKTPRDYHPQITAASLGCWIGLWGLGVLLAMNMPGTSLKLTSQFEFDTAMRTFGIAEGTGLDMQYSLSGNPNAQQFVKTDVVVKETIGDETVYVDESEEPAEIAEEIEEAVDYGYNVMNIDFDALIAETDSDIIKSIHEYVNSLEPSAKNEYTGLFEGKNLITISAESFALQAINEDLTPTLYRLANNGIKFTDFYQPAWGGSTSTGEYSILIGLVPTDSTDSMLNTIGDNLYFTTGNQFQRLGYTSLAFHNGTYTYYDRDKTHTNLGYDSFTAFGSGLEDLVPKWSEDEPTFRATMETYIDQQPFNVYYMSYSGHCDYVAGDPKVTQYYDELKEYYGDTYKDTTLYYLCYQMEFEHALTTMVDMLEEAGIADDTVIVICPDHYPYGLAQSSTFGNTEDYLKDLYKVDSYDGFVRDRTSLIIWSGCIEDMGLEVDTPVYSLDILPTISNLFGLEYDSRLLVGRDVFSDEEPLCIWADYSFLTEKGWYNADTGVFLPTTDEEVTDEYMDRIMATVQNKVAFSMAVPNYDYYGILFGEDDVK